MNKYQEQYCTKHKQHYASYLKACPTCAGEEIGKEYRKEVAAVNEKLEKIKQIFTKTVV